MKSIKTFLILLVVATCCLVCGCQRTYRVTVVTCTGQSVEYRVKGGRSMEEQVHVVYTELGVPVNHTIVAYYTDEERRHLFTGPIDRDMTLYAREALNFNPTLRFFLGDVSYRFHLLGWEEEFSASDFGSAVLGSESGQYAFFFDEERTRPLVLSGNAWAEADCHFLNTYYIYVSSLDSAD